MKNPLNQKILFLKIKSQDKEAYSQFYDLYVARIYRFIFFKVSSINDAQDLTSEVFLKVWQYIKEGKEIKSLKAFIYMVARNTVIDFYRQRNQDLHSINDPEFPDLPDSNYNELQKQIVGSDLEVVLKGINGLKDEYREVIVLRFLDELSIKEISDILQKTPGAVRVLLHRALKSLKDSLPPSSDSGEDLAK